MYMMEGEFSICPGEPTKSAVPIHQRGCTLGSFFFNQTLVFYWFYSIFGTSFWYHTGFIQGLVSYPPRRFDRNQFLSIPAQNESAGREDDIADVHLNFYTVGEIRGILWE
jgi:hypothetical protein